MNWVRLSVRESCTGGWGGPTPLTSTRGSEQSEPPSFPSHWAQNRPLLGHVWVP